jgi:hypothetical protein
VQVAVQDRTRLDALRALSVRLAKRIDATYDDSDLARLCGRLEAVLAQIAEVEAVGADRKPGTVLDEFSRRLEERRVRAGAEAPPQP